MVLKVKGSFHSTASISRLALVREKREAKKRTGWDMGWKTVGTWEVMISVEPGPIMV